jgi:hypothetical protein
MGFLHSLSSDFDGLPSAVRFPNTNLRVYSSEFSLRSLEERWKGTNPSLSFFLLGSSFGTAGLLHSEDSSLSGVS